MPVQNCKQKGLRISNYALLFLDFKRHHGSKGVKWTHARVLFYIHAFCVTYMTKQKTYYYVLTGVKIFQKIFFQKYCTILLALTNSSTC